MPGLLGGGTMNFKSEARNPKSERRKINGDPFGFRVSSFVIRIFLGIWILGLGISASATEYFCDYSAGSNSNSGTRSAPWKEPPGTVSPTGSTGGWVKLAAGDTVYLKGGQTFNLSIDVTSTYYSNGSGSTYGSGCTIASGHLASPLWGSSSKAIISGQSSRKFGFY